MKHLIVIAAFMTLMSGKIKLTEEQYSARAFALRKTNDPDIYEIDGKIGFKKGEEFFYEGDVERLIKSGHVADADRDTVGGQEDNPAGGSSDEKTKPEELKDGILKELRSHKDKKLGKLAESLGIKIEKFVRDEVIGLIAARLYAEKMFEQIVDDLEELTDEQLSDKAAEVGVLAGNMKKDDLVFAIAEKIFEADK